MVGGSPEVSMARTVSVATAGGPVNVSAFVVRIWIVPLSADEQAPAMPARRRGARTMLRRIKALLA
jgi:hypothetical protein